MKNKEFGELLELVNANDVLSILQDRERILISKKFGLVDEPMTFAEIAKEYHVSSQRVKQIVTSGLHKLREAFDRSVELGRHNGNIDEFRIEYLNISKNTKRLLIDNNIRTIKDLLEKGLPYVLNLPGIGVSKINELSDCLERNFNIGRKRIEELPKEQERETKYLLECTMTGLATEKARLQEKLKEIQVEIDVKTIQIESLKESISKL